MRGGIAGIQFQGELVFPLRSKPVPIVINHYGSHRSMGIGQLCIQLQSPPSCCPGLGVRALRRQTTIESEDCIGVGQACIGRSVIGILSNGLLKVLCGSLETLSTPFVPEVPTLQIKLIDLGINLTLLGIDVDADLVGDGPGNLALHCEDIAQVAVVAFCPEVGPVADLNELRRDTNTAAGQA